MTLETKITAIKGYKLIALFQMNLKKRSNKILYNAKKPLGIYVIVVLLLSLTSRIIGYQFKTSESFRTQKMSIRTIAPGWELNSKKN